MKSFLPAVLALFAMGLGVSGQGVVTEELPIGFLPMEWVKSALQKNISPQGRTVLVTPTGPLRLTDREDHVAAVRRALGAMQQAAALVPVELGFNATASRVVQRLPVEPPVVSSGIPVPDRYDPPRIIQNSAGGVTVVPSMPRDFRTRQVGPGTVVNPSPTGYQTQNSEVRLTETVPTTTALRRFTASTVPGKPIALTVVRQVSDPAALRALALKQGAIADTEPAWTAAGSELLVRSEITDGSLVVNVTPQLVVATAAPGSAARRIPLPTCAAGVLIARGAPSQTGLLPRTDPEFYRAFLGQLQLADDTVVSLSVKADVQYLGSPPQ